MRERGARSTHGVDGEGALENSRKEVRADRSACREQRHAKNRTTRDDRTRPHEREFERRPIDSSYDTKKRRLFLLRCRNEHAAQRGNDHRRVNDRANQHEAERVDDGTEHLPFDVFERSKRREHEKRDHDDEERRPCNLAHRVNDRSTTLRSDDVRRMSKRMLDRHDRALDDDSEVDGSERHHVAAFTKEPEPHETEEHRERDGSGHDEPGAQTSEGQEQAEHDDESALGEVLRHGLENTIDEVRSIIRGLEDDALRQRVLEIVDRDLHVAHNVAAVAPLQHEHARTNGLAHAIAREGSLALTRPCVDATKLRHSKRHARGTGPNDRRRNVLDSPETSVSAKDDLLAVTLDEAAARDDVFAFDGLTNFFDGDAVRRETCRVDGDSVLLESASKSDHLDNAAGSPNARRDLPFDDRAELLEGARRLGCLDLELVNFPERGRNGREFRDADGGSDHRSQPSKTLGDARTCDVDVCSVLENKRHHRDAELRDASHLRQTLKPRHRAFRGLSHLRFHLRCRERGRARDDGDLDVRDVWHRIDGKTLSRVKTDRDEYGDEEQCRTAVPRHGRNERLHWRLNSDRRMNAPCVTIRSPARSPPMSSRS